MSEHVIYKYAVSFDPEGTWIPEGEVVLVDSQDGAHVTAWVLVETGALAQRDQYLFIGRRTRHLGTTRAVSNSPVR